MGAVNSVRMQTDGLNLHGRLSAFPISRMHTSSSTDNKRRQFWHKSRPQILPRLRQFGREPVGPLRDIFATRSRTVLTLLPAPLPNPLSFPFLSFFPSPSLLFRKEGFRPPLFLFPPRSASASFPSPSLFIDRRINPTWRAKQAESTLTCRRFDGREEISVEFHSLGPRPTPR